MWGAAWEYLVARFQEPSTWVSLGLIFTGAGFNIAPEHWQAIAGFGLIGFGAIGAALQERKKISATQVKSVVEAIVKPQALDPNAPTTAHELERVMKNGNGF